MHTEPTEIVESCQPNRGQKGGRGECAGDRSREEFLELLFAHVADGIFLIELDGRAIDVNPAACGQ
jgi:PAS domain-containing protein